MYTAGVWSRSDLRRLFLILLILTLPFTASAAAPDKYEPGREIIEKYLSALEKQKETVRGLTMDVHMEGKIPRLKKEGKLSALRSITKLGSITYKVLGFWGDDTVKKEVMARYMTADTQPPTSQPSQSIAITPENYHFKYKGIQDKERADKKKVAVHVFELKPKHKRVGLFKGELWLDPATALPVRETGRLVKNPSIFVKKMEFVRDYDIKDGTALLKRMETKTDTRLVGRAELNIDYGNFRPATEEADAATDEARSAR
jgi:hypothetical protein